MRNRSAHDVAGTVAMARSLATDCTIAPSLSEPATEPATSDETSQRDISAPFLLQSRRPDDDVTSATSGGNWPASARRTRATIASGAASHAEGIKRPTADCGRGATQLAASKVLRSFIPSSRSANYWPWRTIVPSSSYRRGDLIAGACLRVGKKDEGVRQESKYVPRQPDSPSTAAC